MDTIKIGVVSDLHTEFWGKPSFTVIGGMVKETLKDADLILLAGDIGSSSKAIEAARRLFHGKPVCMVAGNHEFYGSTIDDTVLHMTEAARRVRNVHFLNRDTFVTTKLACPVRVLGATLWTDYDLYGTKFLSMVNGSQFPDFFSIHKAEKRLINADDVLELHKRDKDWLFNEIEKPFDGLTIVMTHHAPVSFSLHPQFEGDSWSPSFASRLENQLVRDDVELVVWGHTHYSVDRTIDNTRFLSSQVGYAKVQVDHYGETTVRSETGSFGRVIEIRK